MFHIFFIFSITFVFAKLYKVHKFQKTWEFKQRKNVPIYILHTHPLVRRVVTESDKTNSNIHSQTVWTCSRCIVCVFVTMIWTLNDVLTFRKCDFGAPKQVDWNAARSLQCNFFFFWKMFKIDTPWAVSWVTTSRNVWLKFVTNM